MALALSGTAALAQGVAPGGPIGNSTGIGSGLGGVVGGTGPTWPNGSSPPPALPSQSVPPGGHPSPSISVAPPAPSQPSPYPQPGAPFGATTVRPPATPAVPLTLANRPGEDVAFLKGCWRTDVFAHGQQRGTTTWCLDDRGSGRFMYARVDQANRFCHAQAQASYAQGQLELRSSGVSCDTGGADVPGTLLCREGTDGALCTSDADGSATVRLYRVR